MKRLLAIALLPLATTAWAGTVAGSKHDLSAKGRGEFRAETETDPCIFCHIAHSGGASVLTNRPDSGAEYRPYESTTLASRAGAPTGSSRLCLSCHDGTIAVGHTRNGVIRMQSGDGRINPGRRSHLGTDLRRSHPVSMRAPPAGKTRAPARGDAVQLDRAGLVQCTSCHDPHDEWRDPEVGKFLVKPSARSALCVSCHASGSGPTAATHLSAPAVPKGSVGGKLRPGAAPASGAGCGACHVSHSADVRGRLLKDGLPEDDLCLSCHGSTTEKLVSSDLAKAYAHVTPNKGRHDAAEGPDAPDQRRLPEASPGALRHVTCADCHDPHSSTAQPAVAPGAPGALAGVWGVDLAGERVLARYEYEVCLKCHGDSANKPQASDVGGIRRVRRASADVNLRLVFAREAASSHPVAAAGKSSNVPSLKLPYSAASLVYCTDCHASDTGPGAGGQGARGPHGSIYPALLERQYLTDDVTPESPAAYALCYKCHDRDELLSARSTFVVAGEGIALHWRHVVDQSAPCSACHDAHGVSREAGNERNNAHLISFDLAIVRPGARGPARYESNGPGRGSCALTCHGVTHEPDAGPSTCASLGEPAARPGARCVVSTY
jgi:predicted CXXCH cytochrome family protein